MTEPAISHDTFVLKRTYDTPVAEVYRAWTDPAIKARWFAGSADALGDSYELDFTVGGFEVNRGGPPGGPVYLYTAQFRDIVAERRIVFTSEMRTGDTRMSVTLTTVEFWASGPATELVFTEQGAYLDGHETASQREEGTVYLLGSLDALLRDPA